MIVAAFVAAEMIVFVVVVVVVVAERIVVHVVHPAAEVTIWILTPSSDPMLRANGN